MPVFCLPAPLFSSPGTHLLPAHPPAGDLGWGAMSCRRERGLQPTCVQRSSGAGTPAGLRRARGVLLLLCLAQKEGPRAKPGRLQSGLPCWEAAPPPTAPPPHCSAGPEEMSLLPSAPWKEGPLIPGSRSGSASKCSPGRGGGRRGGLLLPRVLSQPFPPPQSSLEILGPRWPLQQEQSSGSSPAEALPWGPRATEQSWGSLTAEHQDPL